MVKSTGDPYPVYLSRKARKFIFYSALTISLGAYFVSDAINKKHTYYCAECADGWPSPSIGQRGACSHHGGVVSRFVDNRTPLLRGLVWTLNGLCGVGAVALLVLFLKSDSEWLKPLEIKGEKAVVPLTIRSETRLVEVERKSPFIYETVDEVALVRCPDGKRKSVYVSKIQFRKVNEKYKQDLSTWISTGRGRAGGYTAKAYTWNSKAFLNSSPPEDLRSAV